LISPVEFNQPIMATPRECHRASLDVPMEVTVPHVAIGRILSTVTAQPAVRVIQYPIGACTGALAAGLTRQHWQSIELLNSGR